MPARVILGLCPCVLPIFTTFGRPTDMMTLVAVVHIICALVLIILVLIQDSKSSGALGMGGSSGSNSILGATGAQSLAAKMTVWAAILFACTCLGLTFFSANANKSVVDGLPVTAPILPASAPKAALPQDGAAPADPNAPSSPIKADPNAVPANQAPAANGAAAVPAAPAPATK